MKNAESKLQQACIRWFRYAYPRHIIYSVPNGGYRNATNAAILKSEGALAGVPDLFLMEPKGKYHGLYIEMKVGKNRMSIFQHSFFQEAEKRNYKCVLCRTFDEFKNEIESYLCLKNNMATGDDENISVFYLMQQHPELNADQAERLLLFCKEHTIVHKGCYGDGSIMFPKWQQTINSL